MFNRNIVLCNTQQNYYYTLSFTICTCYFLIFVVNIIDMLRKYTFYFVMIFILRDDLCIWLNNMAVSSSNLIVYYGISD